MGTGISLEKLFEEQEKPPELLFVILPLDDQFVRMRPWSPGARCMCGGGFVKVPRSAIRSVKTTGKTQYCCGKTLQVVAVEFSEEPTLTYKNLFAAVRQSGRTISAPAFRPRRKPKVIRRPIHLPIIEPIFPPGGDDEGGGGGGDEGFTGDPESDEAKYEQCVRECIATAQLLSEDTGTRSPQQFQQWLQQVRSQCETRCFNYLSTGDPNDDGSE